jgi:hypothetical protein
MVQRWKNQRFEDHLCPLPQGTSLIMVGKNILSKFIPGPVCLHKRSVGGFNGHFARITAQPFDPADSPRELLHTQSPGKQQISLSLHNVIFP